MNVNTMMDLLGLRLEDASSVTFTDVMKLQALNNAQDKLVNLLENKLLTELQTVETGETVTSGFAALSDLANDVVRGADGVLKVKVASGKYSTEISLDDLKKGENDLLAGSAQNPLHLLFQDKIQMFPSSITSIDVYYLKMPSALYHNFDFQGNAGGDDTTSLAADASQGLSATNDAYNGVVIYSNQHSTYHVVTDYVGTTRLFTVSPAAGTAFTDGNTFKFLTHGFDALNLSGVTCDLNPSLHELVVSFAEAECWGMDKELDRKASVLQVAYGEVETLNKRFRQAEGIGTKGRR